MLPRGTAESVSSHPLASIISVSVCVLPSTTCHCLSIAECLFSDRLNLSMGVSLSSREYVCHFLMAASLTSRSGKLAPTCLCLWRLCLHFFLAEVTRPLPQVSLLSISLCPPVDVWLVGNLSSSLEIRLGVLPTGSGLLFCVPGACQFHLLPFQSATSGW